VSIFEEIPLTTLKKKEGVNKKAAFEKRERSPKRQKEGQPRCKRNKKKTYIK